MRTHGHKAQRKNRTHEKPSARSLNPRVLSVQVEKSERSSANQTLAESCNSTKRNDGQRKWPKTEEKTYPICSVWRISACAADSAAWDASLFVTRICRFIFLSLIFWAREEKRRDREKKSDMSRKNAGTNIERELRLLRSTSVSRNSLFEGILHFWFVLRLRAWTGRRIKVKGRSRRKMQYLQGFLHLSPFYTITAQSKRFSGAKWDKICLEDSQNQLLLRLLTSNHRLLLLAMILYNFHLLCIPQMNFQSLSKLRLKCEIGLLFILSFWSLCFCITFVLFLLACVFQGCGLFVQRSVSIMQMKLIPLWLKAVAWIDVLSNIYKLSQLFALFSPFFYFCFISFWLLGCRTDWRIWSAQWRENESGTRSPTEKIEAGKQLRAHHDFRMTNASSALVTVDPSLSAPGV